MAVGGSSGIASTVVNNGKCADLHPLLSRIDCNEFETIHWPKLEKSITLILEKGSSETIRLSFEELYRTVYKCVCHHYSETMYARLTDIVVRHLETVSMQLKLCEIDIFLERFQAALLQFHQALAGICAIFNYMNCVYNAKAGNKNLRSHVIDIFSKIIIKGTHAFDVLQLASEKPFIVDPAVLNSIFKGLYSLNPELAKENVPLFSKYIPNILPRAELHDLPSMVKEENIMQEELMTSHGYIRSSGFKRKYEDISEDETIPKIKEDWS